MSLETSRKGISDILDLLRKGEWQIPQFQREFIWLPEQVKNLVNSFIKSYPIGQITTWDQPQNNPHTPGDPLKLRDDSAFKFFEADPAVIKLVLDGKQRLTTLAMVFGGFHTKNDGYRYSGGWYVNIDAMSEEDEPNIVLYKKQREIQQENLDTLATCVKKGIIPFKDFHKLGDYLEKINDRDVYPVNEYPEKTLREKRSNIIKELSTNYSKFQIPVAEIPSTVDLGAVCEIFDVLNTTGTRVSTSDLIHNKLFKESAGTFLLRESFDRYAELNSFGFLCDENRQEFLCQVVTGCYLLDEKPYKASNKNDFVRSIKGKDLIETPLNFYTTFDSNIPKIDSYTNDLFLNIFGGDFKLKEIPYPVQIVLYLSLRWNLEFRLKTDYYTVDELNKVYKAFFWRNTLSNRYDQGFLTQFPKDLAYIDGLLKENIQARGQIWNSSINTALDQFFGASYAPKTKDKIVGVIMESENKGALGQSITMLINALSKYDIVTMEKIDRLTEERGRKVQLHHIFPRNWCQNNEGSYPVLQRFSSNNFANLTPLTTNSNLSWRANSPATAINNLNLDYNSNSNKFNLAFISADAFNALRDDNIELFWDLRADRIAEMLYNLQYVH